MTKNISQNEKTAIRINGSGTVTGSKKKMRSTSITNAVLVGVLIGIVIYSIMKNSLVFLTIIPLFLAYKLINNSKYNKTELEHLLKERNLK